MESNLEDNKNSVSQVGGTGGDIPGRRKKRCKWTGHRPWGSSSRVSKSGVYRARRMVGVEARRQKGENYEQTNQISNA